MSSLTNRSYVDFFNCVKVYCCLAVEDAHVLDEIVTEIFSSYNSDMIISFRGDIEKGNYRNSVHFSETQLMIVVVSSNFLNQEDADGSMKEYMYAVENNIPVLPIAIESGIEEIFNEKCGKLELIFKYRDNYQEILKENIGRLLVLNEEKNQIREHFYGNIFLSYRREDLKYALKSIGEVHSIENCADVGIWYDGELIPGKDYEEEIFERLGKCDFVLMMITPRLLEEGNFIMNAYPRAKELGVKILPYMVENVESEELCKYYEGIFDEYPGGIKGFEELKQIICDIYPEHDDIWNAEHTYYIGLAHFYGIDFEQNIKKAICYFQKAAEKGYVKANKKLVEIFEHGIGISADLGRAIEYQRKYIEEQKKETELPCIEETILVKEMFNLANLLKMNKKHDKARDVYMQILDLYNLNPKSEQESKYYLAIASVYEHIGILEKEIAEDEKGYNKALQKFHRAAKYIDDAEHVEKSSEGRKEISYEYSRIAESIAMVLMEFEDENSIDYADKYIQIAIAPYIRSDFSDTIDNQDRKVLSKLFYENGLIEIKRFEVELKSKVNDKEKQLEHLSNISCIFYNALEYCPEPDYLEHIRDINAYKNLVLILEELKNIEYTRFRLESTSNRLFSYKGYLERILKICVGVNQDKIAKNVCMQKVNECIKMAELLARNKHRGEAVEFYALALEGLSGLESAEYKDDIDLINKLIKQLSTI